MTKCLKLAEFLDTLKITKLFKNLKMKRLDWFATKSIIENVTYNIWGNIYVFVVLNSPLTLFVQSGLRNVCNCFQTHTSC